MGSLSCTYSQTWTAPEGVSVITAECWGGGASGANGWALNGAGGGGGGAYARVDEMPVTPGNEYWVTVAAAVSSPRPSPPGGGGAATAGQSSSFIGDDSVSCVAVGGSAASNATGGAGGQAAACTGDTCYSGGDGGDAVSGNYGGAGGGGEGAGSTVDGNDGQDNSGATGGAGGTGTDGGDGGDGGTFASGQHAGDTGTAPGGGGGGGQDTWWNGGTGGDGAGGVVVISYSDLSQHLYSGSGSVTLEGESSFEARKAYYPVTSGSIIASGLCEVSGSKGYFPVTSGIVKLSGRSISGNYIAFPEEYSGTSLTMDVVTHIDFVDMPCNPSSGLAAFGYCPDFWRCSFILDTTEYNGSVSYKFQIVAKNTGATNEVIELRRFTDSAPISSIPIPAETDEWTYFSTPFTPDSGSMKYYPYVPMVGASGYSSVTLGTGRVIITQSGATKTMLWRPVADNSASNQFGAYLGLSTPRLWGYYGPEDWTDVNNYGSYGTWYWNPSALAISSYTVVLEACCGGGWGTAQAEVRLYDITADAPVSTSNFFVLSGGISPTYWPNANVERKEINPNLLVSGHLYKMQFRLYNIEGGVAAWILGSSRFFGGRFYVKASGLRMLETAWRVAKTDGGVTTQDHGDCRIKLDGAGGNSRLLYVKNESCSKSDDTYTATPEYDYWITTDGIKSYGDGSSATNITSSNAHQDTDESLLPIFSDDWKSNFVSGNMYCMRGNPSNAGGNADSTWTLVLIGMETSYEPPPCTVNVFRGEDEWSDLSREPSEYVCISRVDSNIVCMEKEQRDISVVSRESEVDPIVVRTC